ncbi:rRNA pseudouridine synthase [Weissella paramesenteroides]|uniref:pseudouridine synthase n=1 Tax=Weissella paramesenteroides TaxID=1249 RepID=UPI0023F665F7|nr:pseudouridine synthase [Weissella paramesenteroides]MDF8372357.1 rRNA pseudouridine synthase [Weissella paramesenteroides]MDF8374280.1 rRNA pseudouridine synthase [Weissella paramesenteroides]WIG66142.1 rRNA pseudouridine synthase [Weissella paramesenteroides]
MAERLQKVMAQAGVASRRASEKMITEGQVTVNGQVIRELGTKVEPTDHIEVNGTPIDSKEKLVYFLLDKPRGVVTTNSDDKGRQTVMDIVDEPERVYPVGRLDYDTTGALLLTNDGDLANKLMHPKYRIDKVYVAKVKGIPMNEELEKLRHGVTVKTVQNGRHYTFNAAPAHAEILSTDKKKHTAIVKLTIHEGKYHQVKEMLKSVGHEVIKLTRERYGMLDLTGLTPGEYRPLRHEEVQALKSGRQFRKSAGRW